MRFRVANPRRSKKFRRKSGKKFSAKQLANQRRFAAMAKARSKNPTSKMKRKRSRKSRRRNPVLALANPPRRRRARRTKRTSRRSIRLANPRRRVSRRRHRNPARAGRGMGISIGSGLELLKDAAAIGTGYVAASAVKAVVVRTFPQVGMMEKVVNIGSKFATGFLGMVVLKKFSPRYARDFAVGAFVNGTFDLIAVATGKPLSLGEYVSPRTTLMGNGNGRRLSAYPVGITPLPTSRLARAYGKSLPSAF